MTKKTAKPKKSFKEKLAAGRRQKVTRYTVNKGGKLSASRKGWVCMTKDVAPIEELLHLRTADNKVLRASANKLEAQNDKLNAALVATELEMKKYRILMLDAKTMLDAYDAQDGALIFKLENTINRRGYWRRLLFALLGRE